LFQSNSLNRLVIPQSMFRLDTPPQLPNCGHKFGNFWNYYTFNPPSERLRHIADGLRTSLSSINTPTPTPTPTNTPTNTPIHFLYSDIGCNSGDLSIELSNLLQQITKLPVSLLGIDIDEVLIAKANSKPPSQGHVTHKFVAIDVVAESSTFLSTMDSFGVCDFVSCFSTTMWVHLNYGDEGLLKFLDLLISSTRNYLLIEPQENRSYRNANKRLRKMGADEFDLASFQLRLGEGGVEERIRRHIVESGFVEVPFEADTTTHWGRTLSLYQKINQI